MNILYIELSTMYKPKNIFHRPFSLNGRLIEITLQLSYEHTFAKTCCFITGLNKLLYKYIFLLGAHKDEKYF